MPPNMPNLPRARERTMPGRTHPRSYACVRAEGSACSAPALSVERLDAAWGVLEDAAWRGPLVAPVAWQASMLRLMAIYTAGADSNNIDVASRARDRLETLSAYAPAIAGRARKSGRVPYQVREADWSGRLLIYDPLWQLVTKDGDNALRKAVIAPRWHRILRADWRASQLYLLAGLSGDTMLQADLATSDIYQRLGDVLAPSHERSRDLAKTQLLATIFRAGPTTLCSRAKEMGLALSTAQAYEHRERIRDRYKVLWQFGQDLEPVGRHLLWTPAGRRIQLRPDLRQKTAAHGQAVPPGLPTLLAGVAQAWEADALLRALADLAPFMRTSGLRLILHLHDCLVFEAPFRCLYDCMTAVRAAMCSSHAWTQQYAPRPGAPPIDRGVGPWVGAPVEMDLAASWGGQEAEQ